MVDLDAAGAFMAGTARILDRRRFGLLVGEGDVAGVLAALAPYGNADGGYGWGIEPDLRSPESQPVGALMALEVWEDVGQEGLEKGVDRVLALCDWLASATLADGGLPFALRVTNPAGCAPFWAGADPSVSSLHITSAVAAAAMRVAEHAPRVGSHPWLGHAVDYCLAEIGGRVQPDNALELRYSLDLLDALAPHRGDAAGELARLAAHIPPSGSLPVAGGLEDEMMRPLDFAPMPGQPIRALLAADALRADLDRLAGLQAGDGGWPSEWASYSPMAALEWRGWLTVRAVRLLKANGVL